MANIDTTNPNAYSSFAADNAGKPYFFVATPMKYRTAPKVSDSTLIKAGVNDLEVIDPGETFTHFAAGWEIGKQVEDMKVGDSDRLFVLIGDDATNPDGWVCYAEQYKVKEPNEVIYLHYGAVTADNPVTQAELDAAQVQYQKEKDAVAAFLKSIGKADSSGKESSLKKAASGVGIALAGLGIGWVLYNASKKGK